MFCNNKYKITGLLLFIVFNSRVATASTLYLKDTTINPPLNTTTYNDTFYHTVLEATVGIAQPYLLQQGYFIMPGVTVNGNAIEYNGTTYPVSESYFNPGTGYYISDTFYGNYGISNFSAIWPKQCPNAFYTAATKTFFSKIDCVGFGTRLLSAVGDTTITNNPYLNLSNRIKTNNFAPFASKGYVATAYEFAVAFPTLKTAPVTGWEYISGNVLDSIVNAYNHTLHSTVGTYNGVRKGGFANCQAGDVLAFGYGPSASSNGHFMILESKPALLDSAGLQTYYPNETTTKIKKFVTAHKVYAVNLFDDSGQNAHFNDSRISYSGIGHGTVLIITDTLDDAPTGFIFAPSTTISYHPLDTTLCYAISVGRFTPAKSLPVQFSSITAQNINNNTNAISWQTTTEINTDHFNIQRSNDGISFITICSIKAIGTNNNIYHYDDYAAVNKANYYRIQSVDKDGAVSYSVVRELSIINYPLSITPNPAKEIIVVRGSNINKIEVIDHIGRIQNAVKFTNAINPSLNINKLAKGVYYINIHTNNGSTQAISFIKE